MRLKHGQDPKESELMDYQITWYLAQQRFEQANTLATKVTSAGKTLPAWQRLALAANENDVPAIKRILQKSDQLTGLDKVNALRIIGEEQQALDLATQLLKSEQNEEVLETLRRFIVDLKQIYPHGWAVSAKTNNVSEPFPAIHRPPAECVLYPSEPQADVGQDRNHGRIQRGRQRLGNYNAERSIRRKKGTVIWN